MKTIALCALISMAFIITGCIFPKAIDYRLSEEQIKWIPYQLNDTLIFKSLNENVYDSLIVTQLDRRITDIGAETPGSREMIFCRLSDLHFNEHIRFSFSLESVRSTYLILAMYEDEESNCRDATVIYYYPDENLICTELKGDNFDSGEMDKTEMIDKITINGIKYTQVIHITADENFQSPTPGFCNLGLEFYYSLNKGLIKYKLNDKEYIISNTTDKKTILNKKEPLSSFLLLADTMESLGWIADTSRLKEVPIYNELKNSKIQEFNNKTFYKLNLSEHIIFTWENSSNSKANSINYQLFEKAKSIWAYFYRNKTDKITIRDGVIEQWEFDDENTAKLALQNLEQVYPLPYFNTQPYYLQVENYLFIFNTRASAFSYSQKKLYEIFKSESTPKNLF